MLHDVVIFILQKNEQFRCLMFNVWIVMCSLYLKVVLLGIFSHWVLCSIMGHTVRPFRVRDGGNGVGTFYIPVRFSASLKCFSILNGFLLQRFLQRLSQRCLRQIKPNCYCVVVVVVVFLVALLESKI